MNKSIKDICHKVLQKYRQDKNVLGIMLIGSVARNKFDQHSDIDIYILLKKKGRFSRYNFLEGNIRVDIIFDSIKDVKSYLIEDKNNIKRVTSHMLAYGKILYERTGDLRRLQLIAKRNLRLKTKYKSEEILMHKYSIDDFWGEVQRDIKNKDYLAFGLDSQLLINNIVELFLKINKEYYRQPNEMFKVLNKIDQKFARALKNFCRAKQVQAKQRILSALVDYIYKKSGGPLPKKWFLK